jgi:hypothetical protein
MKYLITLAGLICAGLFLGIVALKPESQYNVIVKSEKIKASGAQAGQHEDTSRTVNLPEINLAPKSDPFSNVATNLDVRPPECPLSEVQIDQLKKLVALMERDDGSAEVSLNALRDWAAQDPSGCLTWVASHFEGAARSRCLDEAIAIWSASSPTAALDWLNKQPSSAALADAYAGAFSALTRNNPEMAAGWLDAHPDLASRENQQILISTWADADAGKALAWVQQKVAPTVKEAMLPLLLTVFQNESSAETLLRGVNQQICDTALTAAIKSVADMAPEYALQLSAKIADQAMALAAMDQTIEKWKSKDPDACQSWLAKETGK